MTLLDQIIVKTLPIVPRAIVGRLSKPYIAGSNLAAAVTRVQQLNQQGFRATIDVLGEFVTDFSQAEHAKTEYLQVLEAINTHRLDANISIKPTSFGLLLDQQRCRGLIEDVLARAAALGNFMRLDMEDSPCTGPTLTLYQNFRRQYPKQVGVVLQAYMRRTLDDIAAVTAGGFSHFRLCKGIYIEPEQIAYKGFEEVRANFLNALQAMFDTGAFVGIATHDDYLVEQAATIIKQRGLGADRYEFQMLLGVRERLRDQIKAAGHNMRIYVPYGSDWYGYSIRRLKENPALAGTFFKAMFSKG